MADKNIIIKNQTILGGCLVLIIYIGLLIFYNYENQLALHSSSLEGFQLDLEKRATSLEYFFSERKYDLSALGNRREISSYFINKNLGMSESYGLKVSLFVIANLFNKTIEQKTIHVDPIYSRLLLLDESGVALVDTASGASQHSSGPIWREFLTPKANDPAIFVKQDDQQQIILAVPYFFKDKFAGELLAWLNLSTFYDHLVKFNQPRSLKKIFVVAENGTLIFPPHSAGMPHAKFPTKKIVLEDFPTNHFDSVPNIFADQRWDKTLGIRMAVRNTPLLLAAWVPAVEIYGYLQPQQLLLATASLAIVILIGVAILLRFNTQNLVLKARFDEATKQQHLLEDKNLQMEQEIVRRYKVEAELLKKQTQLEEKKKELQESMDKVFTLAYYDTLTGLPNRQLCLDRINQALNAAHRNRGRMALLYLDLDQFKNINDTLGHANGDLLLKTVAQRLTSCIRENDTVARIGGDEFILLINAVHDHFEVIKVAEKILDRMDHHFNLDGHDIYTTASIGVVIYPTDGHTPDMLLKHADMAMYSAKSKGRNNFQFFSNTMNQEALQRREMEMHLRQALQNKELKLHYQPQWDVRSGKITGIEALLRWQHPTKGEILPAQFIPLAEETGLIVPIGHWVLEQTLQQALFWQQQYDEGILLAINLSGKQILQPSFLSDIDELLMKTGFNPHLLEFEITESTAMEDAPNNARFLKNLKRRGIQIAIDDFGTGYSSLSYLKNFPIDRIKIDQSFVRDIAHSNNDSAIIEAIIAMTKSLGLQVIAEGVESLEQIRFLVDNSCLYMQGNFFSPPLPAEHLTKILQTHTKNSGNPTYRFAFDISIVS